MGVPIFSQGESKLNSGWYFSQPQWARSSREGSWDGGVDGVENLAYFMHKIALFH